MTDMEQIQQLACDLQYVREKLDTVDSKLSDLRVLVESRVTRLETKASLWGAIAGLLASLGASFILRR